MQRRRLKAKYQTDGQRRRYKAVTAADEPEIHSSVKTEERKPTFRPSLAWQLTLSGVSRLISFSSLPLLPRHQQHRLTAAHTHTGGCLNVGIHCSSVRTWRFPEVRPFGIHLDKKNSVETHSEVLHRPTMQDPSTLCALKQQCCQPRVGSGAAQAAGWLLLTCQNCFG